MLARFCAYGFLKNQRYFEPFFILFLMSKGLSFFEIGLLIAVREVSANALEVLSGALADVWGRRRAMVLSFASYILSFILFYFATNLWLLAAAMAVYGVGEAFRSGTHKTMILTWLRLQGREEERTEVYGTTRSWSKIGSALGVVLGSIWVIWTKDMSALFLWALIPYTLDLINMATYPPELDGTSSEEASVKRAITHLKEAFKEALTHRPLRGLLVESGAFMGTFKVTSDYLQPILQAMALTGLLSTSLAFMPESEQRRIALHIGPVYVVLFLWSAYMSRRAKTLVKHLGEEERAARSLWVLFALAYGVMLVGALVSAQFILVLAFLLLYALEAAWRPILLARFDMASEEKRGATLLSIESQVRSLVAMVLAPGLGWIVDMATGQEEVLASWPVATWGLIVGVIAIILSMARSRRAPETPEQPS